MAKKPHEETRSGSLSDPVEAAKSNPMTESGELAPPLAEPSAPLEEPGMPTPPAPKKAISQHAGKTFVVSNSGVVTASWKGQTCRFHPGDEINEDGYGDGAIQYFIDGGVDLREKVTEQQSKQ